MLHIAVDLIWSVAGLVLMNGVMQLLINPRLQAWMGQEAFGSFQSVIAVVAIMGTTFGVAANYSRMVLSREGKDTNGDYNIYLALAVALCLPVSIVTLIVYKSFSPAETALLFFLMAFTILRYYGDVYFRLKLDYRGYFVYYVVMTAGYCAGLGLYYLLFKNALATMLLGELAAVVFVFFKGDVFGGKRPFGRSEHFSETMKSVGILTGTDLITAVTQQSDRIILRLTWGGAPVTVFYVSTLLGKVVSLLTTPLNGVMIGYLTKYDGRFTRKMYAAFTAAMLGLGVLATVGCFVASLLFVKLFYPDVFEEAKPYFLFANMGQVFFFISNCMMTILLRVASEKYQMYVNLIYLVVYAAVVIPMTWKLGISGLVWGLMIANVTKFAVVTLIGMAKVGSGKEIADGA